jgi:tetratricopeptide (TPR) repeat protein
MSSDSGQIVTFYSFKGGTGRTMALANVAWILAASGMRVLVVDWDLEAPGLHRYFDPFIDAEDFGTAGGIIDLVREYEWEAANKTRRGDAWVRQMARVDRHAFSIDWMFPGRGLIDFLSAGRQNNHYAATLDSLDWDDFYGRLGGGYFLDCLRADMKRSYDYTLIDSRAGQSDVADICTVHLPDQVIDCFTFSEQGIDGAARVAFAILDLHADRGIRVLPVPMRVDPTDKARTAAGREVARQRFPGLPAGMTEEARAAYWRKVEVPYRSSYAYEECLATFGDRPGDPRSLLSAYEALVGAITDRAVTRLPPMGEVERARGAARFVRRPFPTEDEVTLRYAAEDRVWAEWITQLLVVSGVQVNDPAITDIPGRAGGRALVIVSRANWPVERPVIPSGRDAPLAVYVDDVQPLPNVPVAMSASLVGRPATVAVDRVLRLLGRQATAIDVELADRLARYPGDPPMLFLAPARNARFSGRQAELQRLRADLRSRGSAAVLLSSAPVTLLGTGGVGKTQLALEYAHRFRGAYDIVWWVDADEVESVEASLADLGERLGIDASPRTALDTLTRWLLVFDNADDPEQLGRLLPRGAGHVLVTSRNRAWADTSQSMTVNVFRRGETIHHLQLRVPSIRAEDANLIGEALGDLPIAVSAAGAWLADTGESVEDYLSHVDAHGPHDAVATIWDLALKQLQRHSPAAHRLLQLCSLLSSDIALELVYSDRMAATLADLDRTVTDRVMRARLVRQINRLALLKLDPEMSRIHVHRLLQHVVRERMTPAELAVRRHEAHLVIAAARPRPEVDDSDAWPQYEMLWPHLAASKAFTCHDESVRQLYIDHVRYLWLRGDLPRARDLAAQVDRAWTALPASAGARPQLLRLRHNHANVLRDLGRFGEALALDEHVFAEQRRLLGDQHAYTLMTRSGQASDLRALGRYRDALGIDETTAAAWIAQFGEEAPTTLQAMHNLAVSHRLAGNGRAASRIDEQVYDLRKRVRGEAHDETLDSASAIGRDLRDAGEYERSATVLRMVSRSLASRSGHDHWRTHNADSNLAVSLRCAGRAGEAQALLDRAYEKLTDRLGPMSPHTLACRLSRAGTLVVLDAVDRAVAELRAVHHAYLDTLGPAHPHVLACMSNEVAAARAAGDHRRARDLAEQSAAGLRAALGADHPHALAARMNLAVCLAETGDPVGATNTAEEGIAALTRMLGPAHPDTLCAREDLALITHRRGGDADEVRRALARCLGNAHPTVAALREGRHPHRIIDPHPY